MRSIRTIQAARIGGDRHSHGRPLVGQVGDVVELASQELSDRSDVVLELWPAFLDMLVVDGKKLGAGCGVEHSQVVQITLGTGIAHLLVDLAQRVPYGEEAQLEIGTAAGLARGLACVSVVHVEPDDLREQMLVPALEGEALALFQRVLQVGAKDEYVVETT